jgi:tRNA (cmo5U34)-methyltransferase
LKPQGVFVNADQVLGSSDAIERQYRDNWRTRVLAAGITENALAAALERMAEDKMSTLSDQLAWLEQAGFKQVNCWFKDYSFVVYAGTSTLSR